MYVYVWGLPVVCGGCLGISSDCYKRLLGMPGKLGSGSRGGCGAGHPGGCEGRTEGGGHVTVRDREQVGGCGAVWGLVSRRESEGLFVCTERPVHVCVCVCVYKQHCS